MRDLYRNVHYHHDSGIGPGTREFNHIGDVTIADLDSLEGQFEGLDLVDEHDIVNTAGYDTERFERLDDPAIDNDGNPSELIF